MAQPWIDHFSVRFGEADASGFAKLTTVSNWLQEVADLHARDLGWGFGSPTERPLIWVLSGLRIQMRRYPRARDRVQVATWPSGSDRLFAYRDFEVIDAEGQLLGVATSAWLLVNRESRRPGRMPPEMADITVARPRALEHDFRVRLEPPASVEGEYQLTVRRGETDVNGHANNVSFLAWVLESAPMPVASSPPPREVQLHYLAEAWPGDELVVQTSALVLDTGPRIFSHRVASKPDNRTLALAKTVWTTS